MKLDNSVKSCCCFFFYILFSSHAGSRYYILYSFVSQRKVRNLSLVFGPEKLTFSISSEHKTTYKSQVLIPCHRWENSARESHNSHHLITQRDIVFARTHHMCVDPLRYVSTAGPWVRWRNLFQNRKIVPYDQVREPSTSLIMAPVQSNFKTSQNLIHVCVLSSSSLSHLRKPHAIICRIFLRLRNSRTARYVSLSSEEVVFNFHLRTL